MIEQPIGVYGGAALIATLRGLCPARSFADGAERDRCRVVIIDIDSHSLLPDPPRKSLVRILFDDDGAGEARREGDIRVPRAAFLAHPEDTLAVAVELAGTIIHAAGLEVEVAYLTQIQELM